MTKHKDRPMLKDPDRRKIVETMVGSAAALSAYHLLPTDWSKPIIEQIFLPAHAATSGVSINDPCNVRRLGSAGPGVDAFEVTGFVTPAIADLTVNIAIRSFSSGSPSTTIDSNTGTTTTASDGTYLLNITVGINGADTVEITTNVDGGTGSATCSDARPE